MHTYVGITDYDWFSFLSQQPNLDEVNFWKPGGKTGFMSLPPFGGHPSRRENPLCQRE
jgi:hypothetical protein